MGYELNQGSRTLRMPKTTLSHRGVGTPAQVPASLEGVREHAASAQARQKMFA